jgi:long-chain acyl-CoA synthetase
MVYGDRRPHLDALLVPAPEATAAWASTHNQANDLAVLATNPEFRRHIGDAVDRVNRDLSPIERVRRFVLADEAFTVANEMSTPTLKIRRHAIIARYGKELEELYEDRRAAG